MEPVRARVPHAELQLGRGSVPLGYVEESGRVYLVARDRAAQWPVAVLRDGRAKLRLSDRSVEGRSGLLKPGAERERILGLFRTKYGDRDFERWYDHPARVVAVDLTGTADTPEGTGRYYHWLETEFDVVAPDYDHHILDNRMNRLLRDRSLALLRPTFRGRRRLLEVGCGSGIETLQMLREGHEITAVDISADMLEQVRRKARADGSEERLTTVKARAAGLLESPELIGAAPFDGAYSTYGAINCEPSLDDVRAGFAGLLGSGAPLVVGIYNRWCAFELLAYTLSGQFERAFGRRTNPVPVGSSRFCVDVYAYSLAEVRRAFRGDFDALEASAVPLFLPPSDLTNYSEKFARRFGSLDRWDARIGRWAPLAAWGDHFLLKLRRRAGGAVASAAPSTSRAAAA